MIYNKINIAQPRKTAFGEASVSEFHLEAAWKFPYSLNSEMVKKTEVNGATISHQGSFAKLATGTIINGHARLETRKAVHYQPGLGGLIRFTSIFSTPRPNTEQLVGYGDEIDGYFFGFIGTQFGILRINNSVRNFTPKEDFNDNLFVGFDPTKLNVYQIAFQWLGGGQIDFYTEDPMTGSFDRVHRIIYTNANIDVSIQNPNLPISAWVKNLDGGTNVELLLPSAGGGLEGIIDNRSLVCVRAIDHTATINSATFIPFLTLYNPPTYFGKINRLTLMPSLLSISTSATGNPLVSFAVMKNATLVNSSFTDVEVNVTPAQKDIDSTALTNGSRLTGMKLNTPNTQIVPIKSLGLEIRPGESLTIAVSSTGVSTVSVDLTFDSEM